MYVSEWQIIIATVIVPFRPALAGAVVVGVDGRKTCFQHKKHTSIPTGRSGLSLLTQILLGVCLVIFATIN